MSGPRVVWKYLLSSLPNEGRPEEPGGQRLRLAIPGDYELLRVAMQGQKHSAFGPEPCLWALVDPKAEVVKVELRLIWTGILLETEKDDREAFPGIRTIFAYVGSYCTGLRGEGGGDLVWHLFEVLT